MEEIYIEKKTLSSEETPKHTDISIRDSWTTNTRSTVPFEEREIENSRSAVYSVCSNESKESVELSVPRSKLTRSQSMRLSKRPQLKEELSKRRPFTALEEATPRYSESSDNLSYKSDELYITRCSEFKDRLKISGSFDNFLERGSIESRSKLKETQSPRHLDKKNHCKTKLPESDHQYVTETSDEHDEDVQQTTAEETQKSKAYDYERSQHKLVKPDYQMIKRDQIIQNEVETEMWKSKYPSLVQETSKPSNSKSAFTRSQSMRLPKRSSVKYEYVRPKQFTVMEEERHSNLKNERMGIYDCSSDDLKSRPVVIDEEPFNHPDIVNLHEKSNFEEEWVHARLQKRPICKWQPKTSTSSRFNKDTEDVTPKDDMKRDLRQEMWNSDFPIHHNKQYSSFVTQYSLFAKYEGQTISQCSRPRNESKDIQRSKIFRSQPLFDSDNNAIQIWRFGDKREFMRYSKTDEVEKALLNISRQTRLDLTALDLLYVNKIIPRSGLFSDYVTCRTNIMYVIEKNLKRKVPEGFETKAPDMIDPWEDEVPRVIMSCGHGITCENLFVFCLNQIQNGYVEFVCPAVPYQDRPTEQCATVWDFREVRKKTCLSKDECNLFEMILSCNMIQRSKDISQCPLCSKFIESTCRRNGFTICKECSKNGRGDYKFCVFCLGKWNNQDGSFHCGNRECQKNLQKLRNILRSCPTKEIVGIQECPTVRACPKCNFLVEHEGENCKHMDCPSQHCRAKFCFVCLQIKTDKYYWPESCGGAYISCQLAPRQSI